MTRPARPFTYEDLDGMPDDGYRREIIGGSLIVTPAPGGAQQRIVLNLGALLRAAETGGTMAMVAPYDWKLPDGGSVQPDVTHRRASRIRATTSSPHMAGRGPGRGVRPRRSSMVSTTYWAVAHGTT